jgi:hypothetical protein
VCCSAFTYCKLAHADAGSSAAAGSDWSSDRLFMAPIVSEFLLALCREPRAAQSLFGECATCEVIVAFSLLKKIGEISRRSFELFSTDRSNH